MRRVSLAILGALVLAILTMPALAQKQEHPVPDYPFPGYPPEFSPLKTSRPAKPQIPLAPATKFVRAGDPSKRIPLHYIVVLKDDAIDRAAPLPERRAAVTAIANAHAKTYLGKIGYIYETALIGYSVALPNEAAAIELSCNPEVSWVEEAVYAELC
jgi:hypothetical protein